jgi:hypothetical protein
MPSSHRPACGRRCVEVASRSRPSSSANARWLASGTSMPMKPSGPPGSIQPAAGLVARRPLGFTPPSARSCPLASITEARRCATTGRWTAPPVRTSFTWPATAEPANRARDARQRSGGRWSRAAAPRTAQHASGGDHLGIGSLPYPGSTDRPWVVFDCPWSPGRIRLYVRPQLVLDCLTS